MKTVNLDALEHKYHTVTRNGTSYRVRPVTGRIANIVDAAEQAEGIKKLRLYYDAVALVLPTMPRDDVDDLSADQLAEIMTLARTQVDAVEEAAGVTAPNAGSPAPETVPPGAPTPSASPS